MIRRPVLMYPTRRATIKQVAAEAGVSTQTVSRVINGRAEVAETTRERVQSVIARLNYQPNAVARSLIGRRTHTIGVVGSGIEYFGPSRTLAGIENQAAELGFSLLLSLLHVPDTVQVAPVLTEMLSRQVEGIIWAVPEIAGNRHWIREFSRPAVPMVFLTMQPQPDLSVVSLDNRTGGRLATEHLLAQGYQHIALITGPLSWWEAQHRQLGWQEALAAAGHGVTPRQIVEGNWSAASGEHAFLTLRAQYPEMDAVFAANDQMAQGVLHAAWRAQVRVPADLAVVGFDDIPEAAYFIPALTTVRQESTALGRIAVRLLSRLIASWQETGRIATLESAWLQPELIVRASSIRPA
jgi:LacI family transcriptional regulator